MSIIIKLNEIDELKAFVDDMRSLPCDINIYKDSYIVDGKSILGLLSLSLSTPVTAKVISDDEEVIKKFEELCTKYSA